MRRPKKTTIDPSWLADGSIGTATAHEDAYFEGTSPDALALILSHLVDQLPEPDRSAVQMVAMAGMTYEDAAEHLAAARAVRPHRKTVWKWCRRGLLQVKTWLAEAGWATELTAGRIPLPDDEVMLTNEEAAHA